MGFIGIKRHYGMTNSHGFLHLVGRGGCSRTLSVTHGRMRSKTLVVSIGVSSNLLSTGRRVAAFLGLITSRPRVTHIPMVVSSSG